MTSKETSDFAAPFLRHRHGVFLVEAGTFGVAVSMLVLCLGTDSNLTVRVAMRGDPIGKLGFTEV